MAYAAVRHSVVHRRGYNNITTTPHHSINQDILTGLLTSAILKDGLEDTQMSFIKKKRSGHLQIVKVVNNLLRNTVVVTYPMSKLNSRKLINVFYKRYRRNTVDKFGYPCRETVEKTYDLERMTECVRLVVDVEKHMRVCPDNLKSVNEALSVRMHGFEEVGTDCLYAFQIYAFDIVRDKEDPMNSIIELSLASDLMTRDFSIRVRDIVNFNDISQLVGNWVVMNYKGAFKIKSKEEIYASYNVL